MIPSDKSLAPQAQELPAERQAPPPSSRFERCIFRVDNLFARIDGVLNRWIPEDLNPLARSGAAANLALLIAVASGIILLIWYKPSSHLAYSSLEAISGFSLGGWVRALHRYSSDLTMLFLFIHGIRSFFARKYTSSRWLPWVTGIAMCALIWFIGWTGYWLVWDQPAQQIAISSMQLIDFLPILGEPMSRLFVSDRLVPSLLFFVVFFSHMILPLGIAVGLAIHLMRVSRVKLLPKKALSFSLIGGIALSAALFEAPLDQAAHMNEKAESFTVDAWYMSPLALGLRFQQTGLWFAMFGGVAITALVPWIFGRRRPAAQYQAVVTPARCHACNSCFLDCPFDAISMVPRNDGRKFETQAQVDPSKCVGCGVCGGSCDSEGIGLQWFDTIIEEKRITEAIALNFSEKKKLWIAFVCSDIDGGLLFFDRSKWQKRLPGFQVFSIPTSAWLRPKFVESLLKKGAAGVMIVRDARHEANARDGRILVSERFAGTRSPSFRPSRAGSENWCVVDYLPGYDSELSQAARDFQDKPKPTVRAQKYTKAKIIFAAAAIIAIVCAGSVFPSRLQVKNPSYLGPEFTLSFKAFGEWLKIEEIDASKQENLPIHMRGRSTEKLSRAPISVSVTLDGNTETRTYFAKGISSDGPALDQWTFPLTPGSHSIRVSIDTGPNEEPLVWEESFTASDRRIQVLTYDPKTGFIFEE